MIKKTLSIILLAIFVLSMQAQITFQKTYGDVSGYVSTGVFHTTDGGYIITGRIDTIAKRFIFLMKTNSLGDIIWTKKYYSTLFSGIDYFANDVLQTSTGDYVILGNYKADPPNSSDRNIIVIKTNSMGDTIWTKSYGGVNNDHGSHIQSTSDGGYIITGYTQSFGDPSVNTYVIKIDNVGNVQWTKTFGHTSPQSGINYSYQAQETTNGGYIIAGERGTSFSIDMDLFLVKTDLNGDTLWSKIYGGSGEEHGGFVVQTSDGGFILAGRTNSFGSGGFDVYVIKTNSSGTIVWSKTYGDIGDEEVSSIQQTTDNGLIIGGMIDVSATGNYDAFLIKINSVGDTLWTKRYGGMSIVYGDDAFDVQQTIDKGFVFTGEYDDGSGIPDVYLVKTDSLGNSGCNENYINLQITNPATISSAIVPKISTGTITSATGLLNFPNPVTVSNLCLPTGSSINENNLKEILISPNPFTTVTTLQIDNLFQNTNLTVYNSFGQIVKQIKNISGRSITLQRDNLPAGVYFIRTTQDNKIISVDKLVITNN